MEYKTCVCCKETKLLTEFHKYKNGTRARCKICRKKERREYHILNKEKVNLQTKEYYFNNKNVARNAELKRLYGITMEDYISMFNQQQGCCAGCSRHQLELKRILFVDHCHTTGKVRGLLCYSCNISLGHARDISKVLRNLADYVDKYAIKDEVPQHQAKQFPMINVDVE